MIKNGEEIGPNRIVLGIVIASRKSIRDTMLSQLDPTGHYWPHQPHTRQLMMIEKRILFSIYFCSSCIFNTAISYWTDFSMWILPTSHFDYKPITQTPRDIFLIKKRKKWREIFNHPQRTERAKEHKNYL